MLTSSQALFQLLEGRGALNTTPMISYADLNMGIPSLVTAIEMIPICIFFIWAFSHKPYILTIDSSDESASGPAPAYRGGKWGHKALIAMWSPMDLVRAHVFAWRIFRAKTFLDTSTDEIVVEDGPPPVYEKGSRGVKVAVAEKVERVDSSSTA